MAIWRPLSIEEEPLSLMDSWVVYEINGNDHHICGYCDEGRVSSKIIVWDEQKRIATTASGRKYKLLKYRNFLNLDAEYVWNIWRSKYNIESFKDISEKYV